MAIQMKQWGSQCLAQGHFDIMCRDQGFPPSSAFPERWLNGTRYTNRHPCIYSASLLLTIHLWVFSSAALVNSNTNLQSQSSSRLPDSSCNSWQLKRGAKPDFSKQFPEGIVPKSTSSQSSMPLKVGLGAILLLCSLCPSTYLKSLWVRRANCLKCKCKTEVFWRCCTCFHIT